MRRFTTSKSSRDTVCNVVCTAGTSNAVVDNLRSVQGRFRYTYNHHYYYCYYYCGIILQYLGPWRRRCLVFVTDRCGAVTLLYRNCAQGTQKPRRPPRQLARPATITVLQSFFDAKSRKRA